MNVLRPVLIPILPLAACACADPIERLCQSVIRERLLYPDTAEFSEFQPISRPEYVNQWIEILNEKSQIRSAEFRASYLHLMHETVRPLSYGLAGEGSSFYTYRMKARGRRGASLSSLQVCAVSDSSCACIGWEPDIERPEPSGGEPRPAQPPARR